MKTAAKNVFFKILLLINKFVFVLNSFFTYLFIFLVCVFFIFCHSKTEALVLPSLKLPKTKATDQKEIVMFGKKIFIGNEEQLDIDYTIGKAEPLQLNLIQAIALALRHNTSIRTAYISRISQRYQFFIEKKNRKLWYYAENSPSINISSSKNISFEQNIEKKLNSTSESNSTNAQIKLAFTSPIGTNISLQAGGSYDGKKQYTAGITVVQPLLRGFGYTINAIPWKQSKLNEQINVLNLRAQVSNVILQIIQQYRQLILAKLTLKNNKQALKEAIKTLQNNEAEVKAGRLAKTELISSKIQVESTRNALFSSEDDIAQEEQMFATLLGLEKHIKFILDNDLKIPSIHLKEKNLISYALDNKPDYLQQQINYKLNQLNLKKTQDEQLWDFSLFAGTNRNISPSLHQKDNSLSFGLDLTIPLDRTYKKKALMDSQLDLEIDKINLNQKKIEIISEVHKQLSGLDQNFKQLKIQEKQLLLQEQQVKNTQLSLKYGRTSAYELATQQQQLNENRNSLISNKINYLNQLSYLDDYLGTSISTWHVILNQ